MPGKSRRKAARLSPISPTKPTLPVAGKPFLEWLTLFLLRHGLKRFVYSTGYKADQIDAVINAIPDETQRYMARVDWDGAAAIESDSQTVGMLSQALGLTEAEMPDLFEFAQAL